MGEDFSRPKVLEKNSQFSNSQNSDNQNLASTFWWREINDELFNKYVEELLKNNLSLKQNYARILQNYEKIKIMRGGLFPEINLDLNSSRNITPINGIAGFNLGGNGKIYNTNYRAELATAWQLDLFGKVRRSIESSKSEFEASIYDYEALRHSLIAQLLQLRISISANYEALKIAQKTAKNQKIIYQLSKKRYDLGSDDYSLNDVLSAKENYYLSKNEVKKYENLLKSDIYEFDILLGKKPGENKIQVKKFSLMQEIAKAPNCLAASLLDRRPDLKSSELRIKAANANVGVAIADLYPNFSISANVGYRGNETNSLINSDQIGSSLIGNITTKLFQGGALRANVKIQKKIAKELIYKYNQDVLNAIKEVEIALASERILEERFFNQNQTLKLSQTKEKIAKKRYEKGLIDLTNYLKSQNQKYQTKINWINLLQAKWNNRISLYLALGGDWLNQNKKNSCKI